MIPVQCDCGRKIAAPEQWLGKRVKCPQCGRPVTVRLDEPGTAAPVEAEARQVAASVGAEFGPPSAASEAGSSSPANQDLLASPVTEEEASPAAGPAASTTSDAPQNSEVARTAESHAAPPRRPLAPAPPVNAVMETLRAPQEDESEYDPLRTPRLIGALGLLVGAASASAFWVPVAKPWSVPAAGVALALAAIGLAVAMSRHGLGVWIPLLALIVSGGAVTLPWWIPLVTRGHATASPAAVRADDLDDSSQAAKSRQVLGVASLKLVGGSDNPAVDLTFKLTNKSGKPIKTVLGSVELYDRDHRLLDRLGLNVLHPLAPKASFEGTNTWSLQPPARAAVAAGRFTAEYRARIVVHADGSQDDFSR